jgi:mannose-6-phosphate isomerase-like protein (cupin superfamily)
MLQYNLGDFIGGWVVGDFDPSLIKTKDFEVSIKRYNAGDRDLCHFHKEADEITIIISGTVVMNGKHHIANDIVLIKKGESVEFNASSDAVTCVIKVPSVKGDKYLV